MSDETIERAPGPAAGGVVAAGGWHLAQINVATLREPLDSPRTRSFVELLAPVNTLADDAPGFVWRLQTPEGDATSIRAFADDLLIVNLSVWTSLEALRDYVFSSMHAEVLRRRREWMAAMREAHLALWWLPAGEVPTVDDAIARLELVRERGPSAEAFTFREPFPAPAPEPSTR
jgi:Domain of unknown function (DUF3291)